MPHTPGQRPTELTSPTWDQRAETLWKWILRGAGVLAFAYVLIVMKGDVPLGAWVIIGGLIGLPNALPFTAMVEAWKGQK